MNTNAPNQRQQDQQLQNVDHRQQSPSIAQNGRSTQRQPLSLATGNLSQQQNPPAQPNPRFSYMATPVEAQAPTFPATQRPPTIPQSPTSPDGEIAPQGPPPASQYPAEKPTVQTPPDQHPAYAAPYADTNISQNTPAPSSSLPSTTTAPQSPGPVPIKTAPYTPHTVQNSSTTSQPSSGPYTPHATHPTPPTFAAPPFSPNAATGPNGLSPALHQPGQISHPNMSNGTRDEWTHPLCAVADAGTCCLGLWCPCILYGRTSYRLARKSAKQDATDLLGLSSCNGHCVLWALACGLQGVLAAAHRVRVRHAYRIEGSLPRDGLESCCCVCCVLVQSELEVRDREERARRLAGPAGGAYVVNERMAYEPQGGK